jgi:hypothetical protein
VGIAVFGAGAGGLSEPEIGREEGGRVITTVASDGRSVASDSQRVSGSERVDLATRKIQYRGGHVFAFTGDFGFFDPAIDWYLKQPLDIEKAPKASKDGGWSLLVLDPNHIMRYSDSLPYGEPFPYPQAFGSGSSYALTALRLGKTPAEAVAVAASFDVWTAGPIQVFDLVKKVWVSGPEALGQLREAAE